MVSNNNYLIQNKKDYYEKWQFFMISQIIKNNFQGNNDILVCFYTSNYSKELTVTSFNIENNFQLINSSYYSFENLLFLEIISSSLFNNSKAIVCSIKYKKPAISYVYSGTSCFIYDNQKNNLQLFYSNNNCLSIKNEFFNAIDKYILICYKDKSYTDYNKYNNIYIYEFTNDFFQLEKYKNNDPEKYNISISGCTEMNSFSINYNHFNNQYDLISDCPRGNKFYLTFFSTNISHSDLESTLISNVFYSNSESALNDSESTLISKIFYSDSESTLISKYFDINSNSEFPLIQEYFDIDSFLVKYENQTKEEILKDLPEIIEKIEIGKEFTIKGDDFSIIIKPTNTPYFGNSTYVNLSQCENILRNSSNISSLSIRTILQMDIKNNNEKLLTNKVEYQLYDDKKKYFGFIKM